MARLRREPRVPKPRQTHDGYAMTIPIEEQIAALQFTIADIMAGPDISIGFVADRVSRLRAALITLKQCLHCKAIPKVTETDDA